MTGVLIRRGKVLTYKRRLHEDEGWDGSTKDASQGTANTTNKTAEPGRGKEGFSSSSFRGTMALMTP